jgi:hypothetical protein
MSVPVLALAPVLIDNQTRAGASIGGLDAELLERASRDDYQQWLSTALAAGGCVRPVRLSGTIRDIDPATGEILRDLDIGNLPDQAIYVPCGDRRASVCPPCAETYRADTYQLIRAGLAGGKGVPESVAIHPCVFATFTAPSFGPVHTHVTTPGGKVARCRARRKASYCPHGRRLSCGRRHQEDDQCLGKPLCPDCYDYHASVVWNAHAPELWRRTVIGIRRRLDKLAKAHGVRVKVSYAKVAEFQRRGLIHFHAIFRLDGHDPAHPERTIPPHPALTADVLAEVIRQATSVTWFATVPHSVKPKGWDITWGAQVDPRVVRLTGTARSPTSRSPPTWPSTPPNPPNRSASCPRRSPPLTPRLMPTRPPTRGGSSPPASNSAATPTTTSKPYGAGRTCSATAATSPPKAGATPPPCAPSAPPAGTGNAASTPAPSATATRPSSPLPTCNGPVAAGAPAETPSSPSPLPPAPASTSRLPARRGPLHDHREEEPAMEQLIYRPIEAAQQLGMGRTAVFALIKSDRAPGPAPECDDPWT